MSRVPDTAIIDPWQEGIVARILPAEALTGSNDFCGNYLEASHEEKLEPRPVSS